MLRGLPTPLDPFEARRLQWALTLLTMFAHERVVEGASDRAQLDLAARDRGRTAGRRRHVRPPRSC